MNLNKQDFAMATMAIGITEYMREAEKAAVAIAGMYATATKSEQANFLHSAKEDSRKAIAMLQQLNEKLDAELASVEGAQQ